MSGFKCEKCGASSLVRSNFRLLPDRRAWCRKPECEEAYRAEQAAPPPPQGGYTRG